MKEIIYGYYGTQDPDESPGVRTLSKNVMKLAPLSYDCVLVSRIVGKDNGGTLPTVGDFADQMSQLEDSLSPNTLVSDIKTAWRCERWHEGAEGGV